MKRPKDRSDIQAMVIDEIAKMIDHSILHPTFTDLDLKVNCGIAVRYGVATVCVKPYHAAMARDLVRGSGVGVCAVIGFPHGNGTVDIKMKEAERVINDGATEVDMVINIGKALQHDWKYVHDEIAGINSFCTGRKAILKVIFETDYVTRDEDKIELCRIASANDVAFVKTSTGYGFVKGKDGSYNYSGATEHDIELMKAHCRPGLGIKAAGGIRTLDQLLRFKALGATRIGATATEAIIEEAKRRFG